MRVKGYRALRLDANKFRKVLSTTRFEAFASLSLWKTPAPVFMHWAKYQYMHPIIWLLSHFWLRGFFWRWPYPAAALSRLLSQPTCFKSGGDNVCQMVALSWATKYKFILPRSEHLRQMKEIAEGTKDLEVESFTKATSSSSVPALLQL